MRIVCISDTHEHLVPLPEGDVLVHAGDITFNGDLYKIQEFNFWMAGLPFKRIVVIAGNHDWNFVRYPDSKNLLSACTYLEDSEVIIEGVKFYGSPWQPEFGGWAFNRTRGPALRRIWDKIPDDTDVLITHGPAWSVLDRTADMWGNKSVGCEELLLAVQRVRPKVHVFGHIHASYGVEIYNDTTCINASICNEKYQPVNKAIVIDI